MVYYYLIVQGYIVLPVGYLLIYQITPLKLIDYCENKNILVEVYSPIVHGEIKKNESIIKMAEKHFVDKSRLIEDINEFNV